MQYRCDYCKALLGDRGPGVPHLSLQIADGSGLAECDAPLPGWRVTRMLRPRTYHFCSPDCLKAFIEATVWAGAETPIYVNQH